MNTRPIALTGLQMLSRLGIGPDPLVGWMEREWRLSPDGAGRAVWKGRIAEFPIRLWTGDTDHEYRTANGHYRIALGVVPSWPGMHFSRFGINPLLRIGGGFALNRNVNPMHPAADRIAEHASLIGRLTASVEDVSLGEDGIRLEILASAATPDSLYDDTAIAADILRIERAVRSA